MYLGNDLQVAFPTYRNIDNISASFNGVTTSFPLLVNGVAPVPQPLNEFQCLISVNGVVQKPDPSGASGFKLSGGNIVFSAAPGTGQSFFGVILAGADYVNVGANFPSGTQSVPSITFDSDLDTGIYNSGANQISFTTAGTERLRIDSVGQIESVSLGTAAAPAFSWTTDTDTGIYSPGANQVAISTSGTGRLFVDASGNVGVGSAPSATAARSIDINGGSLQPVLFLRASSATSATTSYTLDPSNSLVTFTSSDWPIRYFINGSERMRLDSSGRLGLGTSSPETALDVRGAIQGGNGTIKGQISYSTRVEMGAASNHNLGFITNNTTQMLLDTSGRLGIGTTSPSAALHVANSTATNQVFLDTGGANGTEKYTAISSAQFSSGTETEGVSLIGLAGTSGANDCLIGGGFGERNAATSIKLYTASNDTTRAGTERARIDSSGRLIVGASSIPQASIINAVGNASISPLQSYFSGGDLGNTNAFNVALKIRDITYASGSGSSTTAINWTDANEYQNAYIGVLHNASINGASSILFGTANGNSGATERMRITNSGSLILGVTNPGSETYIYARTTDNAVGIFDRQTNDGNLIIFRQANVDEGTISVSGTTVSYNGAHLSRWSQLPGGTERTDILRGTVLSNIDEMCAWGEEDNEQLNRMKVSDVEGDPNVSGVFQAWDDDDDTYTDDFYCAMTGDFIIRIAEGVTVQRGDLLMSAGDGTAKPQDDDIIRSKTIAKVTSNHVTCTYEDGSYCVPCVLMAC